MQLHRDREKFREAGVRLVLIGQGTPENAQRFVDAHDLELELLVDTERRAYKAVGTKVATFGELLGPKMIARGLRRSFASGVRQGRTVGHPAQLGGVVLVMPGGAVPYSHLSDDASDNPPNEEVLEAVRSATA